MQNYDDICKALEYGAALFGLFLAVIMIGTFFWCIFDNIRYARQRKEGDRD